MTKETLEHLSCLMDGELSPEASRFLARRMGSEETLGATWQRYHLIRDCLRRPGESFALTHLSIDLDEVDIGEAPAAERRAPRWLKPVAGTAIAASVAAAAVMVTLNLAAPTPSDTPAPFASPNALATSPVMSVSQPVSLNSGSAANQRSLNRYVLRHQQAAGSVGQQGLMALVPIVATAPVQLVEPADESGGETADSSTAADERTDDTP